MVVELTRIEELNQELRDLAIDEVKYMYSVSDNNVTAQLQLHTVLTNLLIMLRAENGRDD